MDCAAGAGAIGYVPVDYKERTMAIRTGDTACGFELPVRPGETVDVGAHLGTDKVVLLFFPLSFSPVCTDEFCAFRDDWSMSPCSRSVSGDSVGRSSPA